VPLEFYRFTKPGILRIKSKSGNSSAFQGDCNFLVSEKFSQQWIFTGPWVVAF
jgi:hypothetical protein